MSMYDALVRRAAVVSQGFVHSSVRAPDGSPMYAFGTGFGLDGMTHTGVDILCDVGDLMWWPFALGGIVLLAGADGAYTDIEVGNYAGSGNLKVLQEKTGYEVIFGHLRAIYPRRGERIASGDLAGVGGTYYGGHLHLEVRVPDTTTTHKQLIVDPAILFAQPRVFRPTVPALNARAGRSTSAPLRGQFADTDPMPIVAVKRDNRAAAGVRVGQGPDLWGLTAHTATVPNAWVYLPYAVEVPTP